MKESKSKLYKEEFATIFDDKKALRVRGALVISAFIEGQLLLLAKSFLKKHGVKYEPKRHQEYRQSLNVLETNGILDPREIKNIDDFQKERSLAIHGIFKGMTRSVWEKQTNKVVMLGRPIVRSLDEKLYPKLQKN